MKEKKIGLEIFAIILILVGCLIVLYFYGNSNKITINCLNAIEDTCLREIQGTEVTIYKTTDLHGSNAEPCNKTVGSKEDNFASNKRDGVKLWATKQMFLNLGSLKVVKEDYADNLNIDNANLYLIEANHDFADEKEYKIKNIYMFLNTSNYHVYIPKNYCEPKDLINYSYKYIEFESNEITKTLIDLLLEPKS
ncbi:hypothetical protein EHE19_004190 [Ruminiclostridium herbifermentans]|uniref:Uncharacterized protein n=1 Tax=Ruminiclostridium herbifermentans TaxID=2488810 RepID=A0A4U7JFX9_9FIRM|nr:hypothetical protein [Ruminiclostridium herbifermentans]QNU67679.1 hypothetical protein EHE19_004190 [Ruminiclostridium herbifermentans]